MEIRLQQVLDYQDDKVTKVLIIKDPHPLYSGKVAGISYKTYCLNSYLDLYLQKSTQLYGT